MIRACTGKSSAAAFASPLSCGRAIIEKAEAGTAKSKTIQKLVAKALEAYAREIPDFLSIEARKLIDAPAATPSKEYVLESAQKKFREIEIKEINRLGIELTTGSMMTDCPSDRAFAIVVRDTSLTPEVQKGAFVVLDPDAHPSEGNLVGASLASSGIIVRRYSKVGGSKPKIVLTSPHYQEYPPRTCTKNELLWIHPVYSITLLL